MRLVSTSNESSSSTGHTHTWGEYVIANFTCEDGGIKYRQCCEMSHLKYVDDGKISNIYKGVDIEHTVVVREDYLPKDYANHYTNVSLWKNPVLVQDSIYDMRWAYVLPINARYAIESLLKF